VIRGSHEIVEIGGTRGNVGTDEVSLFQPTYAAPRIGFFDWGNRCAGSFPGITRRLALLLGGGGCCRSNRIFIPFYPVISNFSSQADADPEIGVSRQLFSSNDFQC
jgi:hypothetical protein